MFVYIAYGEKIGTFRKNTKFKGKQLVKFVDFKSALLYF